MKIGIFGGSFDPPHLAHLIFACDAYHKINLNKILWVVTNVPSHKSNPVADFEDRLKMTRLTTFGYQWMEVSDIERTLPRPNYSYNLIKVLYQKYGTNHEWFMMIGQDQAEVLNSWHKIEEIRKLVKFVVISRNKSEQEIHQEYSRLERRMDISSSEIRTRIKQQQEYRCFLLPSVAEYIEEKELYH